jgi:pyruvate dehydrogenase E1 component
MPEGSREGILKGLYKYQPADKKLKHHVQLFGSGCVINAVLQARDILAEKYGVSGDVWGATSYTELRRDALECERHNRLHPNAEPRKSYLETTLEGVEGPFIAASDYMKALPDLIVRWLPGRLVPLGTDGFGMSDTREALRRHFEVDAENIVIATLDGLRQEGKLSHKDVAKAIKDMGVDPDKLSPLAI